MVRKHLKSKNAKSGGFRLRGLDNTRIEALSDGVFALAIALLLISSSAPEKFEDLKLFIQDFIPFAITVVLLTVIWYQHYLYCVRYGLKDAVIVSLNTLLLILILYYVYPLKFLFTFLFHLFRGLITNNQELLQYQFTEVIKVSDGASLMIIYGIGAGSIFLTISLMYLYAYKKRKALELTEEEQFDTRSSIYANLLMASVPYISVLIAALGIGGNNSFSISGIFYMIYPIVMPSYGILRQRKKLNAFPQDKDEDEETENE